MRLQAMQQERQDASAGAAFKSELPAAERIAAAASPPGPLRKQEAARQHGRRPIHLASRQSRPLAGRGNSATAEETHP